jgi:hypothetical protein
VRVLAKHLTVVASFLCYPRFRPRYGNHDPMPVVQQEMTAHIRTGLVLGVVAVAALVTSADCAGQDTSPVATTSTTIGHSPANVSGVVTADPTCPVERINQPCPPRPVSAEIDARTQAGKSVAATHTDPDGRYTLVLPPGTYILTVRTTGLPRCPPTPISVRSVPRHRHPMICSSHRYARRSWTSPPVSTMKSHQEALRSQRVASWPRSSRAATVAPSLSRPPNRS